MPSPYVVYVGFAQRDEWCGWAATYARHSQRFEDASGLPCIALPYLHATPERMAALGPAAVVLSGFARSFEQYEVAELRPVCDWVETAGQVPILALCGSHQLLGFLYNGAMGSGERLRDQPMRKRRPGEPVTNPDYHPDYFMERGFYELTLLADDPLFAGCGRPPVVNESHYCEIKDLPAGFRLLASTPDCRIQAMRHESRPIWSVQFHPEEYTETFADGRAILRSFFREAGCAQGTAR